MKSMQDELVVTEDQSILLKKVEEHYTVLLQSRINDKWLESAKIPLITLEKGVTISATDIQRDPRKGRIGLQLRNREEIGLDISTEVNSQPKFHPWIHFKTKIKFKEDYTFSETGPEIKIDLLPKSHFFDDFVTIRQPSRHTPSTDEWKSNDMPATAVWNPESKVQIFFFMDFTTMDWMSPRNIERFSIYECGVHSSGKMGLVHRIPLKSVITFVKGTTIIFDYYITQEYNEERPTQWDLMENLVTKCFQLVPGSVPFPRAGLNWTKFAEGCINDLLKEKYCWVDPKFPKYFAYVMDESELQRRKAIGRSNVFETMTLLDLLSPWMLYLSLKRYPEQKNHVSQMYQTLNHFIDPVSKFLYNNVVYDPDKGHNIIKATENSIGDSWYFFEPILRFGWTIRLAPLISTDPQYIETFRYMVKRSTEFVKKHNYEITAFYDPFSLKPLKEILDSNKYREAILKESRGEEDIIWKRKAKNYACLGIHLYIVIQAYYLFQESQYLEEAIRSAKKLAKFSPDSLFWEPFEIAYAVSGFSELAKITKESTYLELARKFLLNELRMFYWYDDNSFDWKGKRSNLGLPMACIGIRYPAVKENIESILPWLMFLKTAMKEENNRFLPRGVMKFLNLVRINTFYFFSSVLPKEFIYPPRRDTPCPYIPFEDLEMLETPHHFSSSQEHSPKGTWTGTLGREIYGAGEIIYLYLMFEALADSTNPNIMVLNLDLFDFSLMDIFPPKKLNFVIYNPLFENTKCRISFHTKEHMNYEMRMHSLTEKQGTRSLTLSRKTLNTGVNFDLNEGEILNVVLTPID